MEVTKSYLTQLTYEIIGCAIEVHKELGPGLLESVYEKCFVTELQLKGLNCQIQQTVPVHYKGEILDAALRIDIIVEDIIIVELKAVERIIPVHEAILQTYMRLLEKPKGILINFNCKNIFKEGQKTIVNEFFSILPEK